AGEQSASAHGVLIEPSHLVLGVFTRIEQAVGVNDEIAHARVVDRALRGALPRIVGGAIVRIGADKIDCFQVFELGAIEPLQLAAYDEMQKLPLLAHASAFLRGSGKCDVRSISK